MPKRLIAIVRVVVVLVGVVLAGYAADAVVHLLSTWLRPWVAPGRPLGDWLTMLVPTLLHFAVWVGLVLLTIRLIYGGWRIGRLSVARLALIAVGYAGAAAAAIAGMGLGIFLVHTYGFGVKARGATEGFAAAQIVMLFAALYLPMLAFLPAAAVIVYAERTHRRSALFYGLGGVVAAVVVVAGLTATIGVANALRGGTGTFINARDGLVQAIVGWAFTFGLPGLCGGLAYWAIAGRTTGGNDAEPSSAAAPG